MEREEKMTRRWTDERRGREGGGEAEKARTGGVRAAEMSHLSSVSVQSE